MIDFTVAALLISVLSIANTESQYVEAMPTERACIIKAKIIAENFKKTYPKESYTLRCKRNDTQEVYFTIQGGKE